MPRQELANACKEGAFRMVLYTMLQILRNNTLIGSPWRAGISKNLFNFQSENNMRSSNEMVERLYTEAVS